MLFIAVNKAQYMLYDTAGDAFSQEHSTLFCSYVMRHSFIILPLLPHRTNGS